MKIPARNLHCTPFLSAALRKIASASPHLDQQLAEVPALEQAEERDRRVFQALDHVFAVFETAAAHPVARFGRKIRYDEAAQRQALAQHREHVGPGIGDDALY